VKIDPKYVPDVTEIKNLSDEECLALFRETTKNIFQSMKPRLNFLCENPRLLLRNNWRVSAHSCPNCGEMTHYEDEKVHSCPNYKDYIKKRKIEHFSQ
jgi:predicted RNA-binding Zn-ribbon protein involved in translation (DUF1610 family)